MKLMSSWTSRHGCRASFRMRLPESRDIISNEVQVELAQRHAFLQYLGLDVCFWSVHSYMSKAMDRREEIQPAVCIQ
jgi:hypothetical protein